jgi:hypothetical protein
VLRAFHAARVRPMLGDERRGEASIFFGGIKEKVF